MVDVWQKSPEFHRPFANPNAARFPVTFAYLLRQLILTFLMACCSAAILEIDIENGTATELNMFLPELGVSFVAS
jgi:hypothetical protein